MVRLGKVFLDNSWGIAMTIRRFSVVLLVGAGLVAGACTTSKSAGSTTAAATTAAPTTAGGDTATTAGATTVAASTTAAATTIAPPTGKPFVIGVVNTEGAPGLDFPEFTNVFKAAAKYVNTEKGGFGGRPVQLETCVSKGTPESSQACAQELASKKVDVVMLGLDIFVDYPTYSAAGIPVFGAVPVLPPDYTADAVYITAGNLVVQASTANAITNSKYLGLKNVVVIANDTAATASALASLQPALEKGGATVTVVKGGETETDAGYRSLMQQAAAAKPDVMVSLYGQSGCVALMRARVDLGVTVPVFSNTACLADSVLKAVGSAADGWYFAGASGGAETDDNKVMKKYVSEVTGVAVDKVDRYGFTSVGWLEEMTLWRIASTMQGEVTGKALIDALRSGKAQIWGSDLPLPCGEVKAYSSVCSFSIPFAQYTKNGIEAAFGGDNISSLDVIDAK
jgi:branched-chain amino acid transport system substrate-binding protein